MVKKANINYEYELTYIGVNVDQAFEDQFLRLNNNLTNLCKIQEIKGSFEEFGSAPLVKSKDSTK